MKKYLFAFVGIVALLALVLPASADLSGLPNIVLNPGFENTDFSPWQQDTGYGPNVVAPPYWDLTNPNGGGAVFAECGYGWGNMSGRIDQLIQPSQTASSVPDAFQFSIDFFNYGTGTTGAQMAIAASIDWMNNGTDPIAGTGIPTGMQGVNIWTDFAYVGTSVKGWQTITVSGTLPLTPKYARLRIDIWPSGSQGYDEQAVDNVSLKLASQAVPEPGSLLCLLTALTGMAGLVISRKK